MNLKLKKYWIFQANSEYNTIQALNDFQYIHWEVTKYDKIMQIGDTVMIWCSGDNAGIYAIAEITTNPRLMREPNDENSYWIDEDVKINKQLPRVLVKLKIINKLFDAPILKSIIKNIESLKNLGIIKLPQGTNFPVKLSEWKEIEQLIN